jgi:lipoprotein-releasing system ATP-binding protein
MTPGGAAPGALQARGLAKAFEPAGLARVAVLCGADLEASAGEILAVKGASGSGKSTLLHVLGGMLRPDGGSVELAGTDPWRLATSARAEWRNSQVGFVFQAHRLLRELTALENVLLPAAIAREDRGFALARGRELLGELGLAGRLHHYPAELSGGEAQRVAIARALVRSPRLLLADEPTGNLDREAGDRVFGQLLELQRKRQFIAIVATHDEDLARRCDRVLMIRGGRLGSPSLE